VVLAGVATLALWPREIPAPAVVVPPPAPPPIAKLAPPAPPAAPAIAMNRITIQSTPAEADVMRGPERLGRTPLDLDLSASGEAFDVVLVKAGFKDGRLRVASDRTREYVVRLQAAPRKAATVAAPPPAVQAPVPPPPELKKKPPSELKDIYAE
jgi:hypothetical protein